MRVVVNRTLCESNAVCARLVPEIFVVDDDDRLQITQERPPQALRERVEQAAQEWSSTILRGARVGLPCGNVTGPGARMAPRSTPSENLLGTGIICLGG